MPSVATSRALCAPATTLSPDANIYHKDETVIATYFDDSSFRQNLEWEDVRKSSPCPLKLTYQWSLSDYKKVAESFDCPLACYDCANLCR